MKIITDNTVYVQKHDLIFLNHTGLPYPPSIAIKVCSIVDDKNRYDFVAFDKPEEIEFFKNIDWMIDYNAVKDLSEEEIIALGQRIVKERDDIALKINSMSYKERKQNINMVSEWKLLKFKMYSLRDFLLFKKGHIKMELPEEVDFSTGFIQEKGIRKLINTIFNKKKK